MVGVESLAQPQRKVERSSIGAEDWWWGGGGGGGGDYQLKGFPPAVRWGGGGRVTHALQVI
jgi:hypothetical protein